MNRPFTPTSRLLRTVFVACALVTTVAVGGFIDLLAEVPSASLVVARS
jgi:hypothetical protein